MISNFWPALGAIAIAIPLALVGNQVAFAQRQTLEIQTEVRTYVGTPLAADGTQIALLRTNGRLTMLDRNQLTQFKVVSDDFRPLTREQIQGQLEKEFGSRFQVSITDHFVVVHPPGSFQTWALPFEQLYLQFRRYFQARGFGLDEPEFPLVAVVLGSRAEFDRFLEAYVRLDSKIQGYYSPLSNRIITYRQTDGANLDLDFFQLTTVIHEATHQVAFNTGIHSRLAQTPRWVSEGLATLFEAQGVHNSSQFPNVADRINLNQLYLFRKYHRAGELRGILAQLAQGDEPFEDDPLRAYAVAWGLTFYLTENRPSDYAAYLKALSELPGFVEYNAADRARDFSRYFGGDLNDLEIRMINFLLSQ